LLEAGRVEEAVAAGRRACAKEPRNAVHHNHLARALLARDEVEEARKELKRAARLAPHFPLTRLHEGELRLWLHRRTAGGDPTDRLNALVAFRAVLQGDSSLVDRVFEALEGEVLSPADIRHLLSEDAGPRLRRRVVARLRAVGARAAAAEALAPLVQAGRLVDLRLRAQLYLDQGEGVKAALALRDCLHAVGEGSLGAELRWGSKLLLRANLTELAERLCYEADGLYPGKATVKLELGRVLLIRRKPQEASHVLERAWALGLSKCCPLLGQSYWNAGKPKLAIATWREGLGAPLDRDSSLDLRLRLAQALHAQGQTREAAQLAREVLRLEPEHPLGRRLAAEDQ
jgi:tetratricopeptide (TPR) repeat protein